MEFKLQVPNRGLSLDTAGQLDNKDDRWVEKSEISTQPDCCMNQMNWEFLVIPSGHLSHSYWKWHIEIVDLPIENGDFP